MKYTKSLLLLLGSLAILSSAKKPSIPRHMGLLIGDWDLTIFKTPLNSKAVIDDEFTAPTLVHVSLKQRNDTKILDGFYLSDDLNSKEFVQVNFLDDLTGELLLSKPEERPQLSEEEEEERAAAEDAEEFEGGEAPAKPRAIRTAETAEFYSLLKFALTNESAGHHISQGAFGEAGSYQVVFTDKVRLAFTATVFEDGKDYYTTVLAKKADVPEPSFFQMYSTFIMMGIFLLTIFFKKNPAQTAQAATQEGAPAQEGAAAPASAEKPAAAKAAPAKAAAAAPAKQGKAAGGKKKGKKN